MTVILTLIKSEIEYEVRNETYLLSRSEGNDDDKSSLMQIDESSFKNNKILRLMSEAYSDIEAVLSKYIDEKNLSFSNILDTSVADIVITLNMPETFNKSVMKGLAKSCHSYLVNSMLSGWFNSLNVEKAKDYTSKSASDLTNIHNLINERKAPVWI